MEFKFLSPEKTLREIATNNGFLPCKLAARNIIHARSLDLASIFFFFNADLHY